MAITLRIPTPLQKYTSGTATLEVPARNLGELFDSLEQRYPGIKRALTKADGSPQQFLNVYVNDEDIRFLGGMQCAFKDGDEVLLIPAIAGGK